MGGMHIHILSKEKEAIGAYFFVPEKPYRFNKEDAAIQERINLKISGGFASPPSIEATAIWKKWGISKPLTINTWVTLTQKQRRGWLEVVRIHSLYNKYKEKSVEDNHFYVDMTNVVDMISFYCALGEAMNGPGGYYGFNLDSLEDCFCGGVGATPPFKLHLLNGEGDFNELKYQETIKSVDMKKLQQIKDMLILKDITIVRDY
ncbi:barstar family protein [Paenibacillus alba]|nr:barstar family protein [Paenibacillus alba]